MGYAGGTKKDPTYHNLGDHAETIQIDFDPSVITYEGLLDIFWKSHRPFTRPDSTQYRSVVFYHDEGQRKTAEQVKAREETRVKGPVFTEIVPFKGFYPAEDYHQKHYLRSAGEIAGEYLAIYPGIEGFVASTATARVNGYMGRYGTRRQLDKEIDSLGLSPEGQKRLRGIVGQ